LPASAESTPGRTFGRVADAYARTRPPYSPAAIDRAVTELALGSDSVVLDLAAGTGTLTRALRARFARVIAVEPDPRMRAHLPDALDGAAEAIPLADGSVDAVFVGEAFHWFDFERAFAEIWRVGRGLAVLARSWGEQEQPGLLPRPFKDDLDAIWARFHAPYREFPDWREVVRPDGSEQFVDTVRISGRDLVDLNLTASTPASIDDEERSAVAARAYPLMEAEYDLRVVTSLAWKRLA
jgi:SAM-dependent methyltransferase